MTNKSEYNKTSLKMAVHGQTVHRDYLAHALRWSFVAQRVIKRGDVVVDVGCGPDASLERAIARFPHATYLPSKMYAIDLVRFVPPFQTGWITWMPGTDVLDVRLPERADVVVCLEVIEHMPKHKGAQLIGWIWDVLKPDGKLVLSTPAHDGKHMPRNHVHEYTIAELADALAPRFTVVKRWGTFANVPEVRRELAKKYPEAQAVFDALAEYYSDEVMSVIFAPLFPDRARNNIWLLRPVKEV